MNSAQGTARLQRRYPLRDRVAIFPLQAEDAAHFVLVVLAPQMAVVGSIEQPHGDAHPVAVTNDRAFSMP
jgi:hypothetical protein